MLSRIAANIGDDYFLEDEEVTGVSVVKDPIISRGKK
jgi:hypothetical protein